MQLMAYVRSAEEILWQYQGEMPFAAWLKNYFRQHKKFGSKDRKRVADLCFCYFRLGHAWPHFTTEERLLAGQFLCHHNSVFAPQFQPEWSTVVSSSLQEKVALLGADGVDRLFPFPDGISPEIDKEAFLLSFLQQPDVFLRLRPGKEAAVIEKLKTEGIPFLQTGACLRLPSGTKADELLRIDEDVVVQDISSQRVLEPLLGHFNREPFTAWDCCAASGGKTILLHDAYPKARLTVSDIRESIIINLRNRLKRAGIANYRSFVADVSSPQFSLSKQFDLIICDAPCSGSGTWARTPEQLLYFPKEKIVQYAALQKRIAANAGRYLKKGGYLLYITCSVFTEENEKVAESLQQAGGLRLLSQHYFKGYDQKGDTLYAALFTT